MHHIRLVGPQGRSQLPVAALHVDHQPTLHASFS